jgi:hypothetical protein
VTRYSGVFYIQSLQKVARKRWREKGGAKKVARKRWREKGGAKKVARKRWRLFLLVVLIPFARTK